LGGGQRYIARSVQIIDRDSWVSSGSKKKKLDQHNRYRSRMNRLERSCMERNRHKLQMIADGSP